MGGDGTREEAFLLTPFSIAVNSELSGEEQGEECEGPRSPVMSMVSSSLHSWCLS